MKSARPLLAALTGIALAAAMLTGTVPAFAADEPVHTYRATPGDVASDRFALTANDANVFVAKYTNRSNNRMHVARFASVDSTPTLTVTSSSAITSYKIYPERYYPAEAVTVSGSTLTVDMSESLRYAIIQINGADPGLAIINDRPVTDGEVPSADAANVVDATDYATDLTGATDQTEQIRAAIDALYADPTKDTLYFPDGLYSYAGLELRNRTKPVTIYVDEGALLKNRIQPSMTSMEPAIGIWDSANITISGRGVFDGNGFANYDTSNGGWRHDAVSSHHQGGAMIVRSNDIVFNDTLLRDAKQWNWETHTAKNVTFNNIKGLTPFAQPWIDGLDFASGQHLTVNGAFTLGNDDTFASGHYNPDDLFVDAANPDRLNWDTEDSFDITINDHLGWSAGGGNGIRLGHSAYGHALKDYTFDNVNYLGFSGGDTGITVQNAPDSGVRNYPRYESISISDSSFDTSKVRSSFTILGKDSADPLDRVGQVTLDDVWFSSSLAGSIANVTNLDMSNIHVAGQRVTRLTQTSWTLDNVVNRTLDFADDHAPVLQAVSDTSAEVGSPLTFTLSATDVDGDPITFAAGPNGLPVGATLDPMTAEFAWTPASGQDGTHLVEFVASNPNGASARTTVKIVVTDPSMTRITVPVAVDTNVQTWNAEQSGNFGDNEHLRMLNFNNTARGALGEQYAGNETSQDAKLAFLGFDLTPYAEQLAEGDLVRAELRLTYMGPTKGALTGTNVVKAARVTGTWVEGNGKTTPSTRPNNVAGAVTWLTKPTIDSSVIASSDGFSVAAAAKVGNDSTYSAAQAIVGGEVYIDVTQLTQSSLSSGQSVSFALNESNKQDIIFVSREGASRNVNAAGYAPSLTLTIEAADEATVPSAPADVSAALVGPDLSVSWSAPQSDGGAEITEYRVYDGAGAPVATVSGGERSLLVTGLVPGTTASFAVAAVNDQGEGPRSQLSMPVTTASIELVPSAQMRCLGGKAYLYVSVVNRDEDAAAITVRTPYGDKAFGQVAPGKTASVALPTRAKSVPAASVIVEGAQPNVTFHADVAYTGLVCG